MKILLCCAAGMSSSLLVQKMREEVKKRDLDDVKIGACAKNQLHRYLHEADVLLLAPQLSFLTEEINKRSKEYQIIIYNISMEDYGNLDAAAILDQVLAPAKDSNILADTTTAKLDHLYQNMLPLINRISLSRPLNAITSGFTSIMPATVIGSIFTLLNSLPFSSYTNFLSDTGMAQILSLGANTTIDVISIYVVFFITYQLVKSYQLEGHGAGLLALICFFIVTGRENGSYSLTYLGTKGLFGAIFISLSVGYMYIFILKKKIRIRLPENVPQAVSESFEAIIPSFLIITIYIVVAGVTKKTAYGNLHTMIYQLLQTTLTKYMSNNIFSYIFFQMITNLLWFFGIHGGNTVGAITNPIYTPLSLENFALYQAGKEPVNIISSSFAKCFISGGVGSMFSLSIIMTFLAKSQRYRTLGKISLPTTFFFINEPLLFGVPIILNPLFFIPLMFITPILGTLTYAVMKAGIIPIPIGVQLPWTTPPVIYGLLQGSWKIALWEVIMIISAGIMWFPFFHVADRQAYEEENKKCHN